MKLTEIVLKELPFPYFLIDNNNHVVSTSIVNQHTIIGTPFTQLMNYEDVEQFNEIRKKKAVLNLQLFFGNGYHNYRVYTIPEEESCHLFCYPLFHSLTADYNYQTQQLEQKLLRFSLELNEKKKIIHETASQINEANFTNEYAQNLSTLAASMAHEIRNPLTTVKGFLQLLKPYLNESGKNQYVDIALDEINRANDIIHEFLNAAKPTDKIKEGISINKLVHDTFLLFQSEAILKNTALSFQLSKDDPYIYGNAKQLKQVLVNLIKNALESFDTQEQHQDNTINISVRSTAETCLIVIKDTGFGMNEETLEKLFQPFYSTKTTGTGIGLSICKRIIEQHNGWINISSEMNVGTTIKITLPLDKENTYSN
ncbi:MULTISPECIES: sensor histidine kinase [Cytobacillus]|uniref:sensor histidine kinase n=1 Tax=Cytobacillus TaxID=2675230 RepID=UPI001CD5131B|nr:HAMP domain-containing sensor histidine kinase [Cytobacillus kochii]MCA1025973.1 HAMP domain-containing histidine kinase [Cytobacillus kochii]MCM3321433.1 HAMP domain-containing histidine kinase [Cytobacillus kochii]MCM3343733.1 HAMP domain-containing histidine kinase [Cytobacillus kochii]MDM5207565.1 HAMP domain-containing sensor histidine kinase [Cytobacillus kochii]